MERSGSLTGMFSVGIREGLNGLSFSFMMMMAEQPGSSYESMIF